VFYFNMEPRLKLNKINLAARSWNIHEAKLLQPITAFVESRDILT